jgi:hypothetical protein
LDLVNLVASIFFLVAGVASIYALRRRKLEISLSIGGSIIFDGLVLLAIAYDLISGPAKFVIALVVFAFSASSFYIAKKRKWGYR